MTLQDEGLLRAPEVCKIAGITYRQLDHWCREKVIVPHRTASGSGSYRLFTRKQVRDMKIIAGLREYGVPLATIRAIGPRKALEFALEDLSSLAEEVSV